MFAFLKGICLFLAIIATDNGAQKDALGYQKCCLLIFIFAFVKVFCFVLILVLNRKPPSLYK